MNPLKLAWYAELAALGLAGVALYAFHRRRPAAGLTAAAIAGGAAWYSRQQAAAARVVAAKPVSTIDPAFVDSLPQPSRVN